MSPFERALVELGAGGRDAIVHAHAAAVASGGLLATSTSESERLCSTQELLCLAGNEAVDLAMVAQIFEAAPLQREHVEILREVSARTARMTARALEVHARDTGYDPGVWITAALDETEFAMSDDHDELFPCLRAGGECVGLARAVSSRIFGALNALPADRMGVPGHVAAALGASVALFMIADSCHIDG